MKNPPIKTALFFLLLSSVLLTNLQAADPLLPAAPAKYVTDNAIVIDPVADATFDHLKKHFLSGAPVAFFLGQLFLQQRYLGESSDG